MRKVALLLSVVFFAPLLSTTFLMAYSSEAHAAVDVVCFNDLFKRQIGQPRHEHDVFPAVKGPATVKVYNGNGGGWLDRATVANIIINGRVIFRASDFNKKVKYLETQVSLLEGNNSIDVNLLGMPGVRIRVKIEQQVNAKAAAVIGPNGGTIEDSDPNSDTYGVKIIVPPNSVFEPVIFSVASQPDNIDIPLLPQYTDVISAIVTLNSSTPFDLPVTVVYPITNSNITDYKLSWLDETNNIWVAWDTALELHSDTNEVHASLPHFTKTVLTSTSDCNAPGSKQLKISNPTCEQKWKLAIYLKLITPQLFANARIAKDLMDSVIDTNRITQDLTEATTALYSLQGLGKASVIDLLEKNESASISFLDYLYPNSAAPIHKAMVAIAACAYTPLRCPEYTVKYAFTQSLNMALNGINLWYTCDACEKINNINIVYELLFRYYLYGTDISKMMSSYGMSSNASIEDVILRVARNTNLNCGLSCFGNNYNISNIRNIFYASINQVNTWLPSYNTASSDLAPGDFFYINSPSGSIWRNVSSVWSGVSIGKADRIYCTLRTTTDGSTPSTPPAPTPSNHDSCVIHVDQPVDCLSDNGEYIRCSAGPWEIFADGGQYKKINIRFGGYNDYGSFISDTFTYTIDNR